MHPPSEPDLFVLFEDGSYYAVFSTHELANAWIEFRKSTTPGPKEPLFTLTQMGYQEACLYMDMDPGRPLKYWDTLAETYAIIQAKASSRGARRR